MLPALAERNLAAFGEALHEYNARAGEPFRAAQGGPYVAETTELIAWLRGQGVRGVGQSSWGPTVFAVVGSETQAHALLELARRQCCEAVAVAITAARNRGAALTRHSG